MNRRRQMAARGLTDEQAKLIAEQADRVYEAALRFLRQLK